MPTYSLVPCPLCGHMGEELASAEELKAELESLWGFHERRLRPEVPPERLADRLAFSQRPPLRLARCASCGVIWRNPAERAEEVTATYAREAPAPHVLAALHDTQRATARAQAMRLTAVQGGPGTVLEVGSYVGGFLSAAREAGWLAEGVDVNHVASEHARSRGHRVTHGELSDVDPSRRWDAIVLWNCFDQLPDPRATLREARERLVEDGVLALRVPNGGLYARTRRLARGESLRAAVARGVLAHNNLLGFPYRWGFTPRALVALVESLGFRVERVVGDVLVPLRDRWTRPWARLEERMTKGAMRVHARMRPADAPWFEVYARR
ncbi:MAG TPA: class I SAM-dependent methyltransferase [Gemmatimonadaceae bacterium]|nr:class I SAM-dependent methyltransferase [Gemmatimonadaceae bacterium]